MTSGCGRRGCWTDQSDREGNPFGQFGAPREGSLPGAIRHLVEAQDRTRFDRAHFKEFADAALLFEVAYFVLDPDMNLYMDLQQAINLGIHRWCRTEGVALAQRWYPEGRP
jgi:hypothetical protein